MLDLNDQKTIRSDWFLLVQRGGMLHGMHGTAGDAMRAAERLSRREGSRVVLYRGYASVSYAEIECGEHAPREGDDG